MPDDFVINVRQITQYPPVAAALFDDAILIQRGGLGGPYKQLSAADLVASALADVTDPLVLGGDLQVGGSGSFAESVAAASLAIGGPAAFGGDATFSRNLTVDGILTAPALDTLTADVAGLWQALQAGLDQLQDTIDSNRQWSVLGFNGRYGCVELELQDILDVGGAPLVSPGFAGCPTAWTPPQGDCSNRLATTAFVARADAALRSWVESQISELLGAQVVRSFNGRTGDITLNLRDIEQAGGASLAYVNALFCRIPPGLDGIRMDVEDLADAVTDVEDRTDRLDWLFRCCTVQSFNGRRGAVCLTLEDVITVTGQIPQGPVGPRGPPGEGLEVKGAVSDPSLLPTTGNDIGDLWLIVPSGDGYLWVGPPTDWLALGPVQGPQGVPGPAGPPGPPGPPGSATYIGVLPPPNPAMGDFWWSEDDGELYVFDAADQWVIAVNSRTGPQGAPGPAGPPGAQGVAGATGPPGGPGPVGPAGPQGNPGGPGVAGPAGPAGPQGPPGSTGGPGVTDGSNAPPGWIGEYLENIQPVNLTAGSSPGDAAQQVSNLLVLSPGDWDVQLACYADVSVVAAQMSNLRINAAGAMPVWLRATFSLPGNVYFEQEQQVTTPVIRMNITVATAISPIIRARFNPATSFQVTVYARARRVR